MTPGQAALIEAMRVEQARIYGRLCKEHPQSVANGCGQSDDVVRNPERPAYKEDARQMRLVKSVQRRHGKGAA